VKLVDLNAQFRAIEDDIRAAIERVLQHGRFVMGPEVHALERELAEYCGVAHAVTAASGTDALLMALMAKRVGPGDAVIVPAFTFVASAEVIQLVGAAPVFADVDEDTFNLDPERLSEAARRVRDAGTLNLRGVMAVDLFGLPADYAAIDAVAGEHGLFVIADAAQSFGGALDGPHGRVRTGALGDLAATSFFPAKPLGCYGDGGALFTDDGRLADLARSIREHGMGAHRYEHLRTGICGRLDTIQAAVLRCKLKILDRELAARRRLAERYTRELEGVVEAPRIPPGYESAWAQYTVKTPAERRDAVRAHLQNAGIPTAIYYPRPLHQQPAYRQADGAAASLPVAEQLSKEVFSLPIHPYLGDDEQTRVIEAVKAAVRLTGRPSRGRLPPASCSRSPSLPLNRGK